MRYCSTASASATPRAGKSACSRPAASPSSPTGRKRRASGGNGAWLVENTGHADSAIVSGNAEKLRKASADLARFPAPEYATAEQVKARDGLLEKIGKAEVESSSSEREKGERKQFTKIADSTRSLIENSKFAEACREVKKIKDERWLSEAVKADAMAFVGQTFPTSLADGVARSARKAEDDTDWQSFLETATALTRDQDYIQLTTKDQKSAVDAAVTEFKKHYDRSLYQQFLRDPGTTRGNRYKDNAPHRSMLGTVDAYL